MAFNRCTAYRAQSGSILPGHHGTEGVKILWVPVKTAAFQEVNLGMYQAVLDPARPLSKRHQAHVDDAMEEICEAIVKAFSGS